MNIAVATPSSTQAARAAAISNVGVIGLGYVGIPLSLAASEAGYVVHGFDIDVQKILDLCAGRSPLPHVSSERISRSLRAGRICPTLNFMRLREMDVIILCTPTPLDDRQAPDLRALMQAAVTVGKHLRKKQLIISESTSWPGTTSNAAIIFQRKPGLHDRPFAARGGNSL